MTTTNYTGEVYINVSDGHRAHRFISGDPVARVTSPDGSALRLQVSAATVPAAAEMVWHIGNRAAVDNAGVRWPRDVRSMCTGDLITLTSTQDGIVTLVVAATGFDRLTGSPVVVPFAGRHGTSRIARGGGPTRPVPGDRKSPDKS